jgi:uncharacterized protein with HEPN domain
MDIEIKSWLYDIQNAILEIESFLNDLPDFHAYSQDLKTKRAVERNLEIIGEAMNRITKKNSEIIFVNSRKIIDTRNRIIHGYDSVSDEVLWSIIANQLPILKEEIQNYI